MPTYIRVKDLPNAATSPAADDFILLSGAANGARRISRADFLAAVAGFYTSDPSTYKLATLDAGNKVLVSQLPSSAFSYQGTWAASTNTPTLANGTGTGGDTYYASDSGSVDFGAGSISFLAGDAVVYDGTIWQKVPDVVNLLDGKGTLDEAKTTLEIPDVGTAPNETPLNQHLGSLAYADADSVSVDKLEVESTTGTTTTQALTVTDGTDTKFLVREDGRLGVNTASPAQDVHITGADPTIRLQDTSAGGSAEIEALNGSLIIDADIGGQVANSIIALKTDGVEAVRIDSSQRVGIGTSSPGSLSAAANNLVVGSGTGNQGLTVFSGSANEAAIYFADGTAGNQAYRSYIVCQHASDNLVFGTAGATRWTINSTGNLVAGSGLGIDFGSAATSAGQGTNTTGSVSNSVFSDYEFGSWVPRFEMTGANFAAITMDVIAAQYCKVGRHVHCQAMIRTDNVDTSGASGTVAVNGLPFVSETTASNYGGFSVGWSTAWVNAPNAGFVQPNSAYVHLTRNGTTGMSTITASDVTNGASANKNELIFTVSYIAST